ncbi:MAG: hypothetical protein JWN70_1033 [Planctomycetaceae bacterium]|nr:hypothetical protein [Planctomycetaceae bacterium]
MSRTSGFLTCCVTAIVLAGGIVPVQAQNKAVPINVVHAGIDRLYADLDYVFGLAKEPVALKNLKDTLDVFFVGVDPKVPGVVQVYVRKGKFNSVLFAPTIPPPARFRANLRALGIKSQMIATGGVFSLKGLFIGFLKEGGNVTIIAEDRADLVPLKGGNAAFKLALDPKDHDFMASIENEANQIKDREAAIEELRKQVLPGLKQRKKETPARFSLRKLTIDQQLNELKQAYSEASKITLITNLDPKEKMLVSTSEITALPNTELAKSLDELAKTPSYFAHIPRSTTEPLSAAINLKLDALRQKHVKAFLKELRPIIQSDLKETGTFSEKSKDYISLSTDIVFDVLDKATEDGLFDSFVNVHKNESGKHTMIGGTKVDGSVIKAGLEKLKEKAKVEMDAGKIGDVELHKVTLPDDMTELHEIYGKELVLILGTSPKAVWYAMGENAEAKLKEAIEKVGQPAPETDHIVVFVHAKALLWFELWDAIRTKHKTGNADDRKVALDIFKKGADNFDLKVEKVDGTLKGVFTMHEGLLHYAGKVAAKFVKENLTN